MSHGDHLTRQGVRYLLVGGYNVAFTLAVFWVLDTLWGRAIGVQTVYWSSAALGVINGFIAQRIFVWKSNAAWHGEMLKFIALNAAVSAINSFLLFLTVTTWQFPAFPSQVGITAVLTLTSFLVSRHWVFRPATRPEEERTP